MALKNIPDPGFSDDDGTASPELTAALAAWAEDRTAVGPVLAALRDARLLVPVVAVLGEVRIWWVVHRMTRPPRWPPYRPRRAR
ncbi:SseB family protein, partial [Streptomyces sp. wa22]|uniref:SseB family protein n=1 Tax=Streptomyces sp. wa22 TaxID=1828244 RepID=UPI0021CA8F66